MQNPIIVTITPLYSSAVTNTKVNSVVFASTPVYSVYVSSVEL